MQMLPIAFAQSIWCFLNSLWKNENNIKTTSKELWDNQEDSTNLQQLLLSSGFRPIWRRLESLNSKNNLAPLRSPRLKKLTGTIIKY